MADAGDLKSLGAFLHSTAPKCKQLKNGQMGENACCDKMQETAPKLTPN
jgi:hypothetical protein